MKDHEARVAVGARLGMQSSLWNIWTWNNHAYLSCSSYGGTKKVSLHEDGRSHWSWDANWWAKHAPGRPNRDRHITKWVTRRPVPGSPVSAFRIFVPLAELRTPPAGAQEPNTTFWIHADDSQWVGPDDTPRDSVICVHVFIAAEASEASAVSHPQLPIKVIPFADGRALVAVCEPAQWPKAEMQKLRDTLASEAQRLKISPTPGMRGHFFIAQEDTLGPGFFEFAIDGA